MVDLRELSTYEDAIAHHSRDALWAMFDGDTQRLNMAHECVDRHRGRGTALNVAYADGRDEAITFRELSDWSSRIAHRLASDGIDVGDRVAIMLDPGLAFYASLFGVMKRGAIAVPLFTLFGPEGLAQRLRDCEPKLLLSAEHKLAMARASVARRVESGDGFLQSSAHFPTEYDCITGADDLALFQYTAGTTREVPEAVHALPTAAAGPPIEA